MFTAVLVAIYAMIAGYEFGKHAVGVYRLSDHGWKDNLLFGFLVLMTVLTAAVLVSAVYDIWVML